MKRTALLICDIQMYTLPFVSSPNKLLYNVNNLLHASNNVCEIKQTHLSIFMPKIFGSHYPFPNLNKTTHIYTKCTPTMITSDIMSKLCDIDDVILSGIGKDGNISHTAIDLLNTDKRVHLIEDAISYQNETDKRDEFKYLYKLGANKSSTTQVLTELLRHNHICDSVFIKFKRDKYNKHINLTPNLNNFLQLYDNNDNTNDTKYNNDHMNDRRERTD